MLIAILLPAGKIVASLCTRFGIPAIIGELMVGIVAGPGALQSLHLRALPRWSAHQCLHAAGAGWRPGADVRRRPRDRHRPHEGSRRHRISGGSLRGDLAVLLGAGAGHLLGLSWNASLFLGGALTATSVSISARTLMDGGHMASPEASVILGAAVIDDVMGLFVLAFLDRFGQLPAAETFGFAPACRRSYLRQHSAFAAHHPLLRADVAHQCQRGASSSSVGYGAAKRWLDPLILQLRRLSANESVTSCVLALVLVYASAREWLGSVAGITGAYLLGYVFAESKFKADVERTFNALGHGLLIPLFFVSIGLTSDFRALGGHWRSARRHLLHRGDQQDGRLRPRRDGARMGWCAACGSAAAWCPAAKSA